MLKHIFKLINLISVLILITSYHPIYGQSKSMFRAIKKGNYEKVKKLIEVKEVNANVFVNETYTALMFASELGDVKIIRYITRKGADVSKPNKEGITALMIASEKGQLAAVKLLIRLGAFVNTEDNEASTALEYASKKGQVKVVKFLKSKGAQRGYEL